MKKILLPVVGRSLLTGMLSNSKIRFLMRASVVIWLSMAISLQLAAFATNGQGLDNEIILELKHTTLSEALRIIQNKTDIPMVYAPDLVTGDHDISLSKEKRTVRAILEIILKGTDITYVERDNAIVLRRKFKVTSATADGSASASAPPFTVSGKITDAGSGEALAGVNIIVKGTTRGANSDAMGSYTIEVSEIETLVFSFIGFKTIEVVVGNRTAIDVSMIQDATALKEVQIISTNYFSTTKEKSTMNISKVDGKEIEHQPVTSLMNALIGRMPGVDITPINGQPGAASQIQIRGINSLTGVGSYPLYVIDGVQIESRPLDSSSPIYSQGLDPLSGLSPSSIESIEVLKDAAATAIYGSRGANGVIRITTNRAKVGAVRADIDLTAYTGIGRLSNRMDLLNSKQYLAMRQEALRNAGIVPDPNNSSYADIVGIWDTTRYTDWQDVLLGGTSKINDLQGSYTAGNQNTSFRIGGGYHKETTILPGDVSYQRGTGDLSVNHRSPNGKLEVAGGINLGWTHNQSYGSTNMMIAALNLPPIAPKLYDDDGTLNWQIHKYPGFSTNTWNNPLADLEKKYTNKSNSVVTSGTISYQLLTWIKLKNIVSYSRFENNESSINPLAAMSPTIRQYDTGSASFTRNNRESTMIEPQFLFEKSLGDHHLNGIVGGTYQSSRTIYSLITGLGYPSDALLGSIKGAQRVLNIADDNNPYKYVSGYAHLGYDFKGRYLLDLTARRDGSSRFGPGKRYGTFGAVSGGWIFSDEPFIKGGHILSFGKVRGSYGITGNDQIGDYQYLNTYEIVSPGYQTGVSLRPSALYNPDFAWEQTTKLEVGVELSFISNRISLEGSWYNNRSSNQLINYRLSATTGFDGVLQNFDATIENRGFELVVATKNIVQPNFRWSTSFNLSIPRNELISLPGIEDSPYSETYKVGEPLSIQRLYRYKGVNAQTGLFEVEDLNGDGNFDNMDRVFMNPLGRSLYGGITNIITLKSFELTFLLQYSNSPITSYGSFGTPGGTSNQPLEVLNRWKTEGDNKPYQQFRPFETNEFANALQSDFAISDAKFIRLKTLTFSYQFNKDLLNKANITNTVIFLQAQNLLTFSKYKGWDPETGNSGLPPLRIISLGLQVKL
ncbi:SusC/RagA family TonB-linked outer membrane protein [Parachryseolinea silvisoli]|uniref:SusC/RagA family TonB-linked outer membrane protein n=1 Tax=Parachryseolinea silvisoli TaxID=2873601 RepID=UPI00226584B9|nr:SusC/RagA family TonB-linked outer membrane protein [Parachryseolinea silvisoli]MCD9014443.1 SusC/RagA family TonB-linked outer membrane protein [Parachryseolinea silvisoli]